MMQALILGIVQGITEFFPVSSTAHLILFPWFFKWGGQINTLTFDVALHAGTLVALIICFWSDWVDIITRKHRLLWLIIIASFPAGILGILFNHIIEKNLRSPYIISISLVVFGIIMFISEKIFKFKKIKDINLVDAIIIGVCQSIALIPGVSRSGITISAGLFRGLEREASARFSFLLSTPIIAGATALHVRKMISSHIDYDLSLFLIGFISSAVTGVAAIKFLISFLKKYPLNIFVYYRFLLAVIIIAGLWIKG